MRHQLCEHPITLLKDTKHYMIGSHPCLVLSLRSELISQFIEVTPVGVHPY